MVTEKPPAPQPISRDWTELIRGGSAFACGLRPVKGENGHETDIALRNGCSRSWRGNRRHASVTAKITAAASNSRMISFPEARKLGMRQRRGPGKSTSSRPARVPIGAPSSWLPTRSFHGRQLGRSRGVLTACVIVGAKAGFGSPTLGCDGLRARKARFPIPISAPKRARFASKCRVDGRRRIPVDLPKPAGTRVPARRRTSRRAAIRARSSRLYEMISSQARSGREGQPAAL